jgi:hypothetical protein
MTQRRSTPESWRKTSRDTVVRRALPKKSHLPSPGVGSQICWFWRPARPVVGAREWSGWSLGDSSTTARRGKTPAVNFLYVLAWPVVCLYSPGNRPCGTITIRTLSWVCLGLCRPKNQKLKLQNETVLLQGGEPDFGGRFKQVARTRALRPTWPGEASARVGFLSSSPTSLEKMRTISIFKLVPFTFH